ncbi:MAG: hypothetical protein KF727_04255 [Microbacteriaceae bacterium]|nr:hypothetical protein [Microbacteriaceae bacterium]
MINKTRPSDTHAPPREVSRSAKGLRVRETAMPSTSPGIAPYGIANSIELNLNLLDDADDPMRQAGEDRSIADRTDQICTMQEPRNADGFPRLAPSAGP